MKVFVATGNNTGRYHTDDSCPKMHDDATYRTVDVAAIPNRQECAVCAGEFDPVGSGSTGPRAHAILERIGQAEGDVDLAQLPELVDELREDYHG